MAGHPYIEHVCRVVDSVQTLTAKIAAALHDVVEDTPTTLADLASMGFPPLIVAAVDALTRRQDEPYPDFIHRAAANKVARAVKMADLMDNARDSRLAELDPDTAARLRAKYASATELLRGTVDVEQPEEVDLVGNRTTGRWVWGRYGPGGVLELEGHIVYAGGDDYEWGLTVEPADFPGLRELLGGEPEDDVLQLVAQATPGMGQRCSDDPIWWLNERGVGGFWNWRS